MSRRRLLAAALAVAAIGAVAGAATALTSGGDGGSVERLEWAGTPQIEQVPELPSDRVLIGEVRNTGEAQLSLVAADIELTDREGNAVESTARFAAGFGHGLYSPTAPPDEVAPMEQIRLGEIAEIAPGDSAPLTLSWRLDGADGPPVEAEIEGISLAIPD